MARIIGSASVSITPDMTDFRDKSKAEIDAEVKGLGGKVPLKVGIDTTAAKAQFDALKKTLDKTIGQYKISTSLDGKKAYADALKARVQLDQAFKNAGVVDIDVKTDRMEAQMAAADATVSALADKAGKDSGDKFGGGFKVGLGDLIVLGAGFSLAGLPAVMAAAGALGGVALGTALAVAGSKSLQAQGKQLEAAALSAGEAAAAPLQAPISQAMTQIKTDLPSLETAFHGVFAASAKDIEPLTAGLLGLVQNTLPGLTTLLQHDGPAVQAFAGGLSDWGTDMSKAFAAMSSGIPGASNLLKAFMDDLGELVVDVAKVGAAFANGAAGPLITWLNAFTGVAGLVTTLISKFPQLTTVALDFFAIFKGSQGLAALGGVLQGVGQKFSDLGTTIFTTADDGEGKLNDLKAKGGLALSGLGDTVGKLAGALSGPLGLALTAVAVIGLPLLAKAFQTPEDQGQKLNDQINKIANSTEDLSTKLNQLSGALNKAESDLLSNQASLDKNANSVQSLLKQYQEGKIGAEEFNDSIASNVGSTGKLTANQQHLGTALLNAATKYSNLIGQIDAGNTVVNRSAGQFAVAAGAANDLAAAGTDARQIWTQFFTTLTGGDTSVQSLEQSIGSYNKAVKTAGTSTADLHGDFAAAVTQASTTIASFDAMGQAGSKLAGVQKDNQKANLDVVASLVPLAKGNKEYQGELVDIAQQAGLNVTTYAQVVSALKAQGASSTKLSGDSATLTLALSKVTQAQQNLTGAINTDQNAMAAQAILASGGAPKAFEAYAVALSGANGKTNALTLSTADGLYNSLIKAGDTSTQAKNQIYAMAIQEQFNAQQAGLLANALVTQSNKADNLTKSQQTLVGVLGQAESQGKLTTSQTDALTSAVVTNKGHVDDSKQSFDHFANSLNISTQKANALWGQLKNVAGNYAANVKMTISGGGTVTASVNILNGVGVLDPTTPAAKASVAQQAKISTEIHKAAGGAFINGNHSNTDSVPILAKPGELIVPAEHAPNVAQHMAAGGYNLPRFASGGLITPSASFTQAPSVGSSLSAIAEPGFVTKLGNTVATETAAALTSGLKSAQSAAMAATVGGNLSGPLGPAGAGEIANGGAIFRYLMSFAHMTPIAAAGAIASIWGESTWNPMAAGTGGRGLIGWTPAGTISNANYEGGLSTQLPQIIRFIDTSGDWGVISEMNKASSVFEAANEWGKGVERYGINDVHAEGVSLATGIMNNYLNSNKAALGSTQTHTAGGTISEPVVGFGVNSGTRYSFAENGPEYVGPISGEGAGNAGMPGSTAVGQQTLIQQNNIIIKLLQQQPHALARVVNGGASAGLRSGMGRS